MTNIKVVMLNQHQLQRCKIHFIKREKDDSFPYLNSMTLINLLFSITGLQIIGVGLDIVGICFITWDMAFPFTDTEKLRSLKENPINSLKTKKKTIIGLGLMIWGFIFPMLVLIFGGF